MISPLFKVRDYVIKDVTPYGIKLLWDPVEGSSNCELNLFKPDHPIPSLKGATFTRSAPFEIRAEYTNDGPPLPNGTSSLIGSFSFYYLFIYLFISLPYLSSFNLGRWTINDVKPKSDGKPSDVKVKIRLNDSGIISVESAEMVEEIIEEVPASPMETDEKKKDEAPAEEKSTENVDESMQTEEAKEKTEQPEESKDTQGDVKMEEPQIKKKKIRKNLSVHSEISKLSSEILNKYTEMEGEMVSNDKLIFETLEKKNNLESYIYEMREKCENSRREFVSEKIRESFMEQLSAMESWLYDEGESAMKSVFISKLEELQV